MRFVLNGIEYEIIELSQLDYKKIRIKNNEETGVEEKGIEEGIYYGSSDNYSCKIYIDKNMPIDRKRKILMHELTHCYIYEYITHSDYEFTIEEVCDLVANSHDIIDEIINNYFMASL